MEIADFASARPTWRAAQTKIILCFSDSPIGVSVFPVPVGELLAKFSTFNKNLPDAIKGIPLCGLASAEGLKDKGDNLHFDTTSLNMLGSRYYEVWSSLKK